jgi:hypothetical protein
MGLPPPPPPPSSSSGGGGKKKKKPKQKYQITASSDPKHNPWVSWENGHISFSNSVKPPDNALTSFGLPIKRSDFLQAQSHYNDLFRQYLGRGVKKGELAHILTNGVSDFALQIHFTHLPGFQHSAVFRSYKAQAAQVLGFNYNLKAKEVREALMGGGDLAGVLSQSGRAQHAVVKDFRGSGDAKQAQALSASFGDGRLGGKQVRALALQENGLQHSTLGKRLQNSLDLAMARYQRIFSGTAATPSLSLSGGLTAPSLLGNKQEPDVSA